MNDVIANKVQSIQRCVQRARAEYAADPQGFDADYTRQDAAVLNVLRACEQAIDLANYVIKAHKLGVPTTSAESFTLLQAGEVIDSDLAGRLQKMVGFRNTVVHHYQRLELPILRAVIVSGLDDLLGFAQRIVAYPA